MLLYAHAVYCTVSGVRTAYLFVKSVANLVLKSDLIRALILILSYFAAVGHNATFQVMQVGESLRL